MCMSMCERVCVSVGEYMSVSEGRSVSRCTSEWVYE